MPESNLYAWSYYCPSVRTERKLLYCKEVTIFQNSYLGSPPISILLRRLLIIIYLYIFKIFAYEDRVHIYFIAHRLIIQFEMLIVQKKKTD